MKLAAALFRRNRARLEVRNPFLGPRAGWFTFSIDLFGHVRQRGIPEAFERIAQKHGTEPNVMIDDCYTNGVQAAYLWVTGKRPAVTAVFREFAEEIGLPHREMLR